MGPCGSGKSTFAKALALKSKLPLHHLDQYFFLPNWIEKNRDEWIKINEYLVSKDHWIIDGNYSSTLDMRIKRADIIIYLDVSTITSLYRVIKRIVHYHGKQRPDSAEGCFERWDWEFMHYVLMFNWVRKPSLLKKISNELGDKQLYIVKSEKNRKELLKRLHQL